MSQLTPKKEISINNQSKENEIIGFNQEKIRICFFIQLEFHHAMLDPIYEILSKDFSCILSSDKKEIINFNPHVIIQSDYDSEFFRKNLPGTLIIYTLHGFGTKNNWKRGIPQCDIVCLANPWIQEQCKKQRIYPKIATWLTGFIPSDKIFNPSKNTINLPTEFGKDPIILYAPTYNKTLNSVDVLGFDWIENLTEKFPHLNLIIKPHPATAWLFPEWIKSWKQIAENNPKVFLVEDCDENIYEYLHLVDLLISDASSVMFYYLALDRPIVLVTNSQRTNDKVFFDAEGAEWNWRDMGIEVSNPKEMINAISRYLKDPTLHHEKRVFYREKVFGSLEPGSAAKNTAKQIREFLKPQDIFAQHWLNIFFFLFSHINENQKNQESLENSQKTLNAIHQSFTWRMLKQYDKSLGKIIRLKPRKIQSEDPLTESESG